MKNAALKRYLLALPEALEDYPFGQEVAVYKVHSKMFALSTRAEGITRVNLKCEPRQALILRDIFSAVLPGYHMNKKHWNTVLLDGSIPRGEIERMIDHSYGLVVSGLPRKYRLALEVRYGPQCLYRGLPDVASDA